ncbi:MAG: type II toxin-antitoxin system RelE/ParE family toxin [Bacteroidota bacterium]
MQRQVVLSKTAEIKLDNLLTHLKTNWSENVKLRFISKLEHRLNIVRQKPEAFPKSEIKKGLFKCVITRQTTMYYTFDENVIYILTFFDNRQDPSILKEEVI